MFDQFDLRKRYNAYNILEHDEIEKKKNLTNDYGFDLVKSREKIDYEKEFNIKKYKNRFKNNWFLYFF